MGEQLTTGLLKNKITEIIRLDNNLQYCTLQLTVNASCAIIFKYYYDKDTPEIIFNDLVQEKIFIDPDELVFFIKPLAKYNSRFISIKNI